MWVPPGWELVGATTERRHQLQSSGPLPGGRRFGDTEHALLERKRALLRDVSIPSQATGAGLASVLDNLCAV